MILTETGFQGQKLHPKLANLLADGRGIVMEAVVTNCEKIEPIHFLAFLAKASGTIMRTKFLKNIDPEWFCERLYESTLEETRNIGMPVSFGPATLSESSLELLNDFEREMAAFNLAQGDEGLFLLVLLRCLDNDIGKLMVAAAGTEDDYAKFLGKLKPHPPPPPPFDSTGRLFESAFNKSGKRVLNLLREETAALGSHKATQLHLLYALLGIENGVLQRAIQFQTIDPVREVHSHLSRELKRPGTKRTDNFELSIPTLHDSVVRTIYGASEEAQEEGMRIGELQIARSLMAMRSGLVVDFLVSRKVNMDVLRGYLARTELEGDEIDEKKGLPINQIEAELRRQLLGQDQAIQQIQPWIKRLRFGFPKERGPAAVLLFLGPSGTGKTQLAKELARTIYGSEEEMVVLEMGHFNSKESINIFIGAPPGYVGYGEGKLTNGLRDKPQSVVLFDEIEKAHEDVWGALLRFLDEGLISDPAGPTRDGRRCIVVLTSNLGSDTLAQRLQPDSSGSSQISPELENAIRDTVLPYLKRPEIYNRVDDKVVFRPFSSETYKRLVQKQVDIERQKFLDLCGTQVEVEAEVIEWLTEQAVEAYREGARCVPRIVNKFIVALVIDLLTDDEERSIRKVIVSKQGNGTIAEEP